MKYFLPLLIAVSIFINPVNAFAEELILAGGCFWCLEHDLESLRGINFVQSGYSGCLLYTSPSPRDRTRSRMPSSA